MIRLTLMEAVPYVAVATYIAVGAWRQVRRERADRRRVMGDERYVSRGTLWRLRRGAR